MSATIHDYLTDETIEKARIERERTSTLHTIADKLDGNIPAQIYHCIQEAVEDYYAPRIAQAWQMINLLTVMNAAIAAPTANQEA